MTDREKAFCINGARNYLRGFYEQCGLNPDLADIQLRRAAREMKIYDGLLDETRKEHQAFLAQLLDMDPHL